MYHDRGCASNSELPHKSLACELRRFLDSEAVPIWTIISLNHLSLTFTLPQPVQPLSGTDSTVLPPLLRIDAQLWPVPRSSSFTPSSAPTSTLQKTGPHVLAPPRCKYWYGRLTYTLAASIAIVCFLALQT